MSNYTMDMIKKTTPTFKKVSETKSNLGKEKKNTIHVKNKYLHPTAYSQCVTYTSLSMKQGSLFCFVCHVDISQIMALHFALLVFSECSQ